MTFNSTIQSRKTQDQLLREAREEVAELRRRIFEATSLLDTLESQMRDGYRGDGGLLLRAIAELEGKR